MSNTKVLIKNARLSYAHLFEPHAMNAGDEGKYSVCLLISKDDKEALQAIKQAVADATAEGIAKKWKGKKPATLKLPLRDGNERSDDPNYEGQYFLNANSNRRPDVLIRRNGALIQATEEDIYSGCYAAVTVTFYAFDSNGNRGIAAGLGNVLKRRDGERLSGGANGLEDFGDSDLDTEDDLSDDFLD